MEYVISLKFRNGEKAVDYRSITAELESAVSYFNSQAKLRNKPRRIGGLEVHDSYFRIRLSSLDRLDEPSKALVVFSKKLGGEEKIQRFRGTGNTLLESISTEIVELEDHFDDSDENVLKMVLEIFLSGKPNRAKARDAIVEVCREYYNNSKFYK